MIAFLKATGCVDRPYASSFFLPAFLINRRDRVPKGQEDRRGKNVCRIAYGRSAAWGGCQRSAAIPKLRLRLPPVVERPHSNDRPMAQEAILSVRTRPNEFDRATLCGEPAVRTRPNEFDRATLWGESVVWTHGQTSLTVPPFGVNRWSGHMAKRV